MKRFLDIIKIKNDALISSITDAINETNVYLEMVDDDKEVIKDLKVIKKRFQSALDIVDGTRTAKYSANTKEMYRLGKLKSKGSKLDKHHDWIVEAVKAGVHKTKIASELKVDRKSLYHYLKKHNIS